MTVLLIDAEGCVLELDVAAPLPIVLYQYGHTYRLSGEQSVPPVYRLVRRDAA